MKNISKRKFTWILSWTSVLLKLLISISRCDGILQDYENVGNMNGNEERILSRQKRYLIFPEGSSIQLIYDEVVTIVDYNLLFLTGETVALAWELPSKPHYDDDLLDIYENGTLPLLEPVIAPRVDNENITKNIIYVNNNEQQSNNYDSYYNRNRDSYYFGDRTSANHHANNEKNNHNNQQYDRNYYYYGKYQNKYNLFNNDNNSNQQQTSNKINYYFNKNNNRKTTALTYDDYHPSYNNENDKLMKPIISNLYSKSSSSPVRQPQQQQKQFEASLRKFDYPNNENRSRQGKQLLMAERKKKHHIYPAFVKRNADNYRLNEVDKYFLNHHRNTRETLYKSIELYLKTKGKNGTECLLKALCETGQRKHQDEPGSFIAEILRAIFSLPDPIKKNNYYERKLGHYDVAHSTTADCTKLYPLCKESLWSSYFII